MSILDEHRALVRDGATTAEALQIQAVLREIELAAWEHELRGPDGKWAGGGGGGGSGSGAVAVAAPVTGPMTDEAREHEFQHHILKATTAAETRKAVLAEVQPHLDKQRADMAKLMRSVRSASQHVAEMQERKESQRARMKLAVEASVIVAGAVLAGVEAVFAVPALVVIASAIGPALVQVLIEWVKRL